MKEARPTDTIASWAFRFLQSLPHMQVVLSGMTTLEQLRENIQCFSVRDPATPTERELLERIAASTAERIPCTACNYCCEDCPLRNFPLYKKKGLLPIHRKQTFFTAFSKETLI